jgi:predicted metalloendopeptidase
MINRKSHKKLSVAMAILSAGMIACTSGSRPEPAFNAANMDTTINPGDDFYQFVNNDWLQNNPIPDDYSRYGSFEKLNEENEAKLSDLLTAIRTDATAEPGSNRQKLRDFYNSAMDTSSLETLGIKPIKNYLDMIDLICYKNEVVNAIAEMHQKGLDPLFLLVATQDSKNAEMMIADIEQSGLGMSDRDYYLKEDARSTEIRNSYEQYIQKLFILAGYTEKNAITAQQSVMNIETALAEASMDKLTLRDPYATYNKKEIAELQHMAPSLNWKDYFETRSITIDSLNVGQPNFVKSLSDMLDTTAVDDWKAYLKWNILNSSAYYLGRDFEAAHFAFYSTTMTGTTVQRDRWKRVLAVINGSLGEALGQEYVAAYFPPEAKDRMIDLVEHLRTAFGQRLSQLEWMSDTTKEKALDKLAAMTVKIGYTDKWIDYTNLDIKNQPYILNVLAANEFNVKENIKEIGKPVDRQKWFMTPQTVNAYYNPTMNEIVFPAAILQPPFFYMDGDDAVNFGAIGMVIGHEMTHGFDDQGRQYAKSGNLQEWWTKDDSKRFKNKTQVLVDHFNNYKVLDTLTINGELTLGENIADLGGLNISFQALQNKLKETSRPGLIDGYTPEQRFFISYAQVWRNHMREQRLRQQINEDPHSPGEARVNGTIYNLEEFYKAFNILESAQRYISPDKRAKIW